MSGANAMPWQQFRSFIARGQPEADGELLHRFVADGDESAFAELLRRHGPMVLGVARRVLGDFHAAEDIFQATFLILARKAASVRRPEFLGAWLHNTAFRLAAKARRLDLHRQERLDSRPPRAALDPLDEVSGRELLALLDAELQALPERYRLPLVLCCLEGLSQEEAARRLGWSPGSVKGRLERGRAQLRGRLARRGLMLPGVLAGPLFLAAAPAVPAALARSTLGIALRGAPASEAALVLTGDMLQALALGRFKAVSAVVLLLGILGAGTGAVALRVAPAPQAATPPAEQPRDEPRQPAQAAGRVDALGDPLPEGALLRLGTVRFRHPDGANGLVLSPDGRTLATHGGDTIRVWDAATGKPRHVFPYRHNGEGFFAAEARLAFSPDGRRMFAAGEGGLVFAWDLASGARQEVQISDRYTVHGVCLSPDGRLLAAGTAQGVIVRDQITGRVRYELENGPARPAPGGIDRLLLHGPYSLGIFSPDGKSLAVNLSAEPEVLRLYETAIGRERQRINLAARLVRLAFSPDGRHLAVTERDNAVRLYETATGRHIRTWTVKLDNPYENYTSAVVFAPDGKSLAAGATDNRIRLWDVATGRERHTLRGHGWYVTGLAFAPDGATLYSASWDGTIRRWDVAKGKELPAPVGYATGVTVAFAPDGARLASAGGPAVHVWDAATGRRLLTLEGGASALAFSPDSRILAAADGKLSVRLWDAATGALRRQWNWPKGRDPHTEVDDVRFSPDGRTLATASFRAREVILWDVLTGQRRATLPHDMVHGISFSPDGRTLASGGWDKALRLWELPSGKPLTTFSRGEEKLRKEHRDVRMERIAYSPDGRLLAIWYLDGWVGLWDTASRREVSEFKAHHGQGRNIAFSPDGLWLACPGEDNTVTIREPRSGQVVRQLRGHQGRICALAFGPDGRSLLSGSGDNTALLWSLRPPQSTGRRDVERLWADLGSADAAAAYRAVWHMAEAAGEAIPLLRQRLKPVQAAADEATRPLIADLDSDSFPHREAATKRLRELGETAETALRAALRANPSAEQKRRIKALLAELEETVRPPSEEALRQVRAVAVLQRIGTPKGREVLERLAGGMPSAALTRHAKAALGRLP
jgi:RNA polymerase sigma factor (sigma-70 family)